MFWFESLFQWLTDYRLAIHSSLGPRRLHLGQSQSGSQTPPLACTGPTGNQLQMQPLEEGEYFRCSSALTRTRPGLPCSQPAQWTFSGPGGRWGWGAHIRGGGPCRSLRKFGWSSVALVKWKAPSPGVTLHWCQPSSSWQPEKKTHLHSFGNAHMCLVFKYVITSNLNSQITTRKAGRNTRKALKTKSINLGVGRKRRHFDC